MLPVSEEKIIESLKIIKKICEDQKGCSLCPFFIDGEDVCGIHESAPVKWNIIEPKKFQALR